VRRDIANTLLSSSTTISTKNRISTSKSINYYYMSPTIESEFSQIPELLGYFKIDVGGLDLPKKVLTFGR
jgi:hypothetical protein